MRRTVLAAVAGLLFSGASVYAHHSNAADFFLDQDVTIEGTIESITLKQPHSIITLRSADSTVYTAEWQGEAWLETHPEIVLPVHAPVTIGTLKVGDGIVVTGAPAKDPARHALVVLKDVRRPRDGWEWTCNQPRNRISCGRGS